MLATLASMCATPSNVENLFVYSDINVGFYVVRMFIHGKITYFTIDDVKDSRDCESAQLTYLIGS